MNFGLPALGALPTGERLTRIKKSPNFKNGEFHNRQPTPMMADDANMLRIMYDFIFKKGDSVPDKPMPVIKSNLNVIKKDKTVITWFGHSSYLVQTAGINILVDPVFSSRVSPVQWAGTKAFSGTAIYGVDDMPDINIVLLTHDHYDHLDYRTIKKLSNKPAQYITPLGVGAHLAYWGVSSEKSIELDWFEDFTFSERINITVVPARHFSGRNLTSRNKSLWAGFILKTNDANIYIGGDSGYGDHFASAGKKYGPFDLAILECGQYNKYWPFIHMMPHETAMAATDLNAKVLFPVHWGKFKLSSHHWNEPVEQLKKNAVAMNLQVTTPRIGEQIILNEYHPADEWW